MKIFYGPADVLQAAVTVRQGVTDGADQLRELLDLVPRLVALVGRAEALLDAAEETLVAADELILGADAARARVDVVASRAEALVERSEALLQPVEQVAPKAMPIVTNVVDSIDPEEVRAVNGLFDRLPSMLDQIDSMGPDVNKILDAVTDLTAAMQGLPGTSALKRRGERKSADEDTEQRAGGLDT